MMIFDDPTDFCCKTLKKLIMDHSPIYDTKKKAATISLSTSEHCLFISMIYCPFCGKAIENCYEPMIKELAQNYINLKEGECQENP